jgi:PAS domain S-box-containing protein
MDTTEDKRTGAALRQLAAIIDSLSYAIIGVDLNGTILSWNVGAERISGYTADEVLGRSVTLLLPPEHANEAASIHDRLRRGESIEQFETVRLRKDGTRLDVSLTIFLLRDETGAPSSTATIARDISTRKQLEAQYLHLQKLDSLGRFAAAIAHDFNNLLVAIVGNTELALEASRSGNPARQELEEIRTIAVRGANLTRQLLAFARQQTLERRVLRLDDLIRDMEPLLRQLAGPQVRLSLSPMAESGRITAYPGHIEQLLVNLVANARDAMPDGGTLTIATAVVRGAGVVSGHGADRPPGQYVQLTVADTGSGMSEEVKQRLFEPFFTTKAPGKGVGLGLATCFGIVKQYDGAIAIDSAPGHGTIVTVAFPCSA